MDVENIVEVDRKAVDEVGVEEFEEDVEELKEVGGDEVVEEEVGVEVLDMKVGGEEVEMDMAANGMLGEGMVDKDKGKEQKQLEVLGETEEEIDTD
jgi:hypothetical protein